MSILGEPDPATKRQLIRQELAAGRERHVEVWEAWPELFRPPTPEETLRSIERQREFEVRFGQQITDIFICSEMEEGMT